MYKLKLTIIALVFFTACQSSPEGMKMAIEDNLQISAPRTMEPPTPTASNEIIEMEEDIISKRPIKKDLNNRKIIKNAQLKMEVESLEESTLNIKAILASLDGYLSNGQMYQSHRELNQYLEFRIPKDNFEAALTEVRKQSLKVLNEKINSRDVSEEFVDIQSRLKTKKEVRDRYIAVLRNKASTIEEILLAEETIRKLQEEIEAKEGRLNYLIDQTSYSTIKINLVEFIKAEVVIAEPYTYPFFQEAKESLQNGWENILMFIVSLLNIWPFIVIACFIFWKRANILAPFKRRKRGAVES